MLRRVSQKLFHLAGTKYNSGFVSFISNNWQKTLKTLSGDARCSQENYFQKKEVNNSTVVGYSKQATTQDNTHKCVHHTDIAQEILSDNVTFIVSETRKNVDLVGLKEEPLRFNVTWLRHNCHCIECRQEASGQWILKDKVKSAVYSAEKLELTGADLVVRCVGSNDEHTVHVPLSYLQHYEYSQSTRARKIRDAKPELWQGEIPRLDYNSVMTDTSIKQKWLDLINVYGLALLDNVPLEDQTVKKVGDHIWPIQRTIYGETFDVRSVPDPINVAYSSVGLGYHMDLVYYESPPGLQLLHCIRFDDCVEGGESVLLDSWFVAELMSKQHPELYQTLCRVPATFQKIHYDRDNPVSMVSQKPHFEHDARTNELVAINWAPPFEGPLSISEEDIEPYYEAYYTYTKLLENSDKVIIHKLQPGELVIFNNRRILHGRREFHLNGGERHLQGCYVHIDEFKSSLSVLNHQLGINKQVKRVFNHSLL